MSVTEFWIGICATAGALVATIKVLWARIESVRVSMEAELAECERDRKNLNANLSDFAVKVARMEEHIKAIASVGTVRKRELDEQINELKKTQASDKAATDAHLRKADAVQEAHQIDVSKLVQLENGIFVEPPTSISQDRK